MALSSQQVEHYFREGYVLAPGLVERAAIDEVRDLALWLVERENHHWQAQVFERANPLNNDPTLHQLFWHPTVVEITEQLFECPARAYYGMVAIVAPRGGRGLPWHQDNMYTPFIGLSLNTFIAISNVSQKSGQLWLSPRSHRRGTLPSRFAGEQYEFGHLTCEEHEIPQNPVQLPDMEPGDAVIFDRNTLHRSVRNDTDSPRLAYAAQYVADNARLAETGQKDPLAPAIRLLARKMMERRTAARPPVR